MSKCKNTECFVHDTGKCYKMIDPPDQCSEYIASNQAEPSAPKSKTPRGENGNSIPVPWDGNVLTPENIGVLSMSSSPIIIGLVGNYKAGKTSYLATLFTLLLNKHRIDGFQFSGSLTIEAWDTLAHTMKFNPEVQYPEPTPSNPDFFLLYHLKLKDSKFRDLLFADASGEVFGQWAANSTDPNAGSARWISRNASAFVFFVDCELLTKRKALAKNELLDIAYRLKDAINERPIAIAWAKGDMLKDIPRELQESLKSDLIEIFPHGQHFTISSHSYSDADQLCHVNNIQIVKKLLDSLLDAPSTSINFQVVKPEYQDYFFIYGESK